MSVVCTYVLQLSLQPKREAIFTADATAAPAVNVPLPVHHGIIDLTRESPISSPRVLPSLDESFAESRGPGSAPSSPFPSGSGSGCDDMEPVDCHAVQHQHQQQRFPSPTSCCARSAEDDARRFSREEYADVVPSVTTPVPGSCDDMISDDFEPGAAPVVPRLASTAIVSATSPSSYSGLKSNFTVPMVPFGSAPLASQCPSSLPAGANVSHVVDNNHIVLTDPNVSYIVTVRHVYDIQALSAMVAGAANGNGSGAVDAAGANPLPPLVAGSTTTTTTTTTTSNDLAGTGTTTSTTTTSNPAWYAAAISAHIKSTLKVTVFPPDMDVNVRVLSMDAHIV